jgi:hypothetical protein
VVLVKAWELAGSFWDGDLIAGLVPSFFSEDIDGSLASIMGDPYRTHRELCKIAKAFFEPEAIPVEEAAALIKKARYNCPTSAIDSSVFLKSKSLVFLY